MNDILPINTLAGRGHNVNAVPLAEVLAEEFGRYRARAYELLESAAAARITTADDAGKAADLVLLIHNFERELDSARKRHKEPYLGGGRTIDAMFAELTQPLARCRTGDEDTIGLAAMIGRWQARNDDAPVYASYASIGSRREIKFEIEGLDAVVAWLLENRPNEMYQAARTIIGTVLRAQGVDAARSVEIPGVAISVVTKTQVR